VGDLREDCEDMDWISPRFEEFLRVLPEVVEPADLSLREKIPMFVVRWNPVLWGEGLSWHGYRGAGVLIRSSSGTQAR